MTFIVILRAQYLLLTFPITVHEHIVVHTANSLAFEWELS